MPVEDKMTAVYRSPSFVYFFALSRKPVERGGGGGGRREREGRRGEDRRELTRNMAITGLMLLRHSRARLAIHRLTRQNAVMMTLFFEAKIFGRQKNTFRAFYV